VRLANSCSCVVVRWVWFTCGAAESLGAVECRPLLTGWSLPAREPNQNKLRPTWASTAASAKFGWGYSAPHTPRM